MEKIAKNSNLKKQKIEKKARQERQKKIKPKEGKEGEKNGRKQEEKIGKVKQKDFDQEYFPTNDFATHFKYV